MIISEFTRLVPNAMPPQFLAGFRVAMECLYAHTTTSPQARALFRMHGDCLPPTWVGIEIRNPIESTFATVRLRTSKTKGAGSRAACLAMAFKLVESAQKRWRKLNGSVLLPDVIAGIIFKDGMKSAA